MVRLSLQSPRDVRRHIRPTDLSEARTFLATANSFPPALQSSFSETTVRKRRPERSSTRTAGASRWREHRRCSTPSSRPRRAQPGYFAADRISPYPPVLTGKDVFMNVVRSLVFLAVFACAMQHAAAISALRSQTTLPHATATQEVSPRPLHVRTTAGWTYIYDGDGNRVRSVTPNGRVTTATYDALSRLRVTTYEGAGPTEIAATTRYYDGNGNLVRINETRGDGQVRLEIRRYDAFDRLEYIKDVYGRELTYRYDDVGNRTHLIDHDGQETVWTYNALNQNIRVAIPGYGTVVQTFTPSGRLETLVRPDGTTTTARYDDAGRLARIEHTKAGIVLALYVYRYDFNGNRIEQRETNGDDEQITRYRYDDADRLVEVIEPYRATTYTLDAVGNRIAEKVVDGAGTVLSESTLIYNERDQLANRDDSITGTHLSQTFDPNGNLETQAVAGTTRTFTYDHRDRLLAFEVSGQSLLRFDYDHEGRRIEKAGASRTTRYQYDLNSLHAETNVIGNTLARYHFSAQLLLVQTITGTTPRHRSYLLDALRNPVVLLTHLGTVDARNRFDVWGRVISQVDAAGQTTTTNRDALVAELPNADGQPLGYTGYIKDAESGLYYAKARYYDPAMARFTTEDPEAGQDLKPPSLHRYLYAYTNPTVFFDPTGRATVEQFAELTQQALAAWAEGNRTALGTAGELHLEKLLQESGHIIVKGPATNPGAHNADIVAYDPETKQLSFYDNKIQTGKETVSAAQNLSDDVRRITSIQQAQGLLNELDLDRNMRREINDAFDLAQRDASKARWIVANANPDDTKVANLAKRISVRLAKKGVRFADVAGENINVRTMAESVEGARGAKKFLARAVDALPIVGTIVSGGFAAVRMDAALADDYAYEQAMTELGGEPRFPFHSSQREAALIAGEEGGSVGGTAIGGMAGGFCGPLAELCVPAGAIAGGLAGDWVGGKTAAHGFDSASGLTEEEAQQMYQDARKRIEQGRGTIQENPSGF